MCLFYTLLILPIGILSGSEIRFTNVECEVLDPSYLTYWQCELKLLGRGIVALNIHAHILQGPITNGLVNLSLWRKYNGYRPFMFNTTFDFCKFMASKNPISFQKVIFNIIAKGSNVNHSCPYDAIIIKNLVLKQEYFKYMPLPTGEYKIQLMGHTNKRWKTNVNVYLSQKEDLINP